MDNTISDKITTIIFNEVTSNQQSDTFPLAPKERTIEAWVVGSGTVGATLTVYGCNTKRTSYGVPIATITLSGTTSDAAGAAISSKWGFVYVVLSGITGTSAAVTFTIAL
jgi:hypothetical protein